MDSIITIKQFTGTSLNLVQSSIERALKTVTEETGVAFAVGKIKYSPSNATITIQGTVDGADTLEQQEYEINMSHLLLPPFGSVIDIRGTLYETVGYKSKNRKYPVICLNKENGKRYKFPASTISQATVVAHKKSKLRRKKK